MASSCRYIPNPFPDYSTTNGGFIESQKCKQTLKKAKEWLTENIIKYESSYPPDSLIPPYSDPRKRSRDVTIYTGLGGNAYVHWKLYHYYSNQADSDCAMEHLMKGLEAINTSLYAKGVETSERGVAFYIGLPGIYILLYLMIGIISLRFMYNGCPAL